MVSAFEKYSDILLEAYQSSFRSNDLALKKKEIFDELFQHWDIEIDNVLFVGFNPGILHLDHEIYLTQVSDSVKNYLKNQGVKFTYVDFNSLTSKQFSVVVAADEYFTFAETDSDQKVLVNRLADITRGFIITTLKDYKNQDYKEKDFSHPICIKNESSKKIFFEQYEYDINDRNAYNGTNYIVDDESVMLIGPFARRAMFFKQLAKFSLDAGATNFLIHKNLMYKSLIKKNYEHIITIKF